jgi:hypothetical protein
MSMRSKNVHVSKATSAIVAALEVITPAATIWKFVGLSAILA